MITHRYHLEDGKIPVTPLNLVEILVSNKMIATLSQIHEYQGKIGLIVYPTIITRPDCAFTASKLFEFLQNPSPKHREAADRAIKHLNSTKTHTIKYSYEKLYDCLICASDAAFADNPDRKSAEGYIFKLFGGPIDWKSQKQKTVTISTTEAELLTLSNAARETYWWMRFFKAIDFNPEIDIEILCENTQTRGWNTDKGRA
jgi:hypothetical protein